MINETAYNTTMSLASTFDMTSWFWIITITVFAVTIFIIFALSKNFRRFLYGGVVAGASLLIWMFSRYIGIETTVKNNYEPIKWFMGIVIFIIVSIIIGALIQKLPIIKDFEKSMEESSKEPSDNKKIFGGKT